jgi:hypothetical protein
MSEIGRRNSQTARFVNELAPHKVSRQLNTAPAERQRRLCADPVAQDALASSDGHSTQLDT